MALDPIASATAPLGRVPPAPGPETRTLARTLLVLPTNGPVAGETLNYHFDLVNFNYRTWHEYEWENWVVADALFNVALGGVSVMGAWKPLTSYVINNIVIDTRDGTMLICTSNHTSTESLDADKASGKWNDYDPTGSPVTVSGTAPATPKQGDLWYATSEPVGLYVWYVDANSAQWVQTNGGSGTPDLPITGGTLTGDLGIEGTSPALNFRETDQIDPAGRYRLTTSAGDFWFQKALVPDWGSSETIWMYNEDLDVIEMRKETKFSGHVQLPIGGPITDPLLEFGTSNSGVHVTSTGELYLVRSGAAALSCLSDGIRIPGAIINESGSPYYSFRETDSILPDGRARIQHSSNALRFVFNTAVAGDYATSITTARYYKDRIELDVPVDANFNELAGSLRHKVEAGYMYIGSYDISSYGDGSCRLWYNHDERELTLADAATSGAVLTDVGIKSANWWIDNSGVAKFRGTFINSDEAGNLVNGAIATITGDTLQFFSGITTGALHQFRDSAAVAAAYVYPAGTSTPNNQTIITREKGGSLYAPISSERYKDGIHAVDENALVSAFNGLTLREWVWGGELPDTDERVGRTGIGVIAEELNEVLPAAVMHQMIDDDRNVTRINGADALALVAVLVAKIREQDERIRALEAR